MKLYLECQDFSKLYDHVPRGKMFQKACAAILHAQGSDVSVQCQKKYSGIHRIYIHSNCATKLSYFLFTLSVLVARTNKNV